jgi:uncharacterized membrane protein YkvA (DUF1232 family)
VSRRRPGRMGGKLLRLANPVTLLRAALYAPRFLRVFLGLMSDRRVPALARLIPVLVAFYFLFPLDVDWLPVLGWVDDLIVLLAGGRLFVRFCPADAVADHVAAASGNGRADRRGG